MSRPIIVHISGDFPDCFVPTKTRAIVNLLDATPEFYHVVYSLNRVSAWNGIDSMRLADNKVAVAYGAPPKGLFLRSRLEALADWIVADLRARPYRPDVIHAHKLSIEGITGRRIADAMCTPFVCSVQADTDITILRVRPDLRPTFRRIWQTADYVLPFSPRGRDEMVAALGKRNGRTSLLPCITHQDEVHAAESVNNFRFVSMFHLGQHRRKNADGLIRAVQLASKENPNIKLDIFGSGTPRDLLAMRALVRRAGAEKRVQLRGPLAHERVQRTIREYVAFVMPTRRESYGMVFAESLLAGVPILQSNGWGIQGLFPDNAVGYSCDPNSINDIKRGLMYLCENEGALKHEIAARQRAGEFNILRRASIADYYRKVIGAVMSK